MGRRQKTQATDGTGFDGPDGGSSGSLTPLLRQYHRIKSQHPDHILLFRCGDFYETFNEDAKVAAQVLGITLTKRGTAANGEPMPLAGVPYHSVEPYLAKLIRAGYKVAICEQMEDARFAKGVVKREVVRVVTPGTVVEDNLLDNKSNNYLAALVHGRSAFGLAALDFSTGQFIITEFEGRNAVSECSNELARLGPSEIVVAREQRESLADMFGWAEPGVPMNEELPAAGSEAKPASEAPPQIFARQAGPREGNSPSMAEVDAGAFSHHAAREALMRQLGVRDLHGFGAEEKKLAVCAAGGVLAYLRETQRQQLAHVNELRVYHPGHYMTLDATTQRSLELVANLVDSSRQHTLLQVLDQTSTAMGGRLLRAWLLQPLRRREEIEGRLDAVATFTASYILRSKAVEALRQVNDMERILSRASCRTANARDLLGLRNSLQQVPKVRSLLEGQRRTDASDAAATARHALLDDLVLRLDPLEDITARLERAIAENPPVVVREGGIIRAGYDSQLDELRSITTDSKSWIAAMREAEMARTAIPNLKIGYNKVFGYYIEVSNSHLAKVPGDYIRKQTLTNGERFITPQLKEKEEIILHAEEKIQQLEFDLFEALRAEVCDRAREIQSTARAIAELDALVSLSLAAAAGNYCRPRLSDADDILIHDGRHPVLEALDLDQPFVPNDTLLDCRENQVLIITGPNMAGKSTYIRQVALITLMVHIGSFVPAREAQIGIVDRIFTRVGAMDHLAKGQSTFLVEMSETANILNNATDRSLVILDEIGRGTSTYDGLSIAWAVVEYLHSTRGRKPKTLFATHYHELVELEGTLSRVKNYNVAVLEEEDRVAFLYKIVRGSTDRSYGIYAAQVAGLPRPAIERAKEILHELEEGNPIRIATHAHGAPVREKFVQLTLFDGVSDPVVESLRSVDVDKLTPLAALTLLAELVAEAKKGK